MIPKHIKNHSHPHRNRHYYGCHCHHHDGQLSWLSLWWLSWAESPSPSSSSLQISSGKRYHKSLGKWMTEPSVILYSLWIYRGRPALFPSRCREMPKRKARQNGPKKSPCGVFSTGVTVLGFGCSLLGIGGWSAMKLSLAKHMMSIPMAVVMPRMASAGMLGLRQLSALVGLVMAGFGWKLAFD